MSIKSQNTQKLLTGKNPVWFLSGGKKLAGNLFIPENFTKDKKWPAIVVATPYSGLKEQTAGIYAEKLAAKGFIALVFDSRTYGESEGEPRNLEDFSMKIEDIYGAINYLFTIDEIDRDNFFGLGLCGGGGYMASAVTSDRRIKAIATVSGFFDIRGFIYQFMGKEALVELAETAGQARQKYYETGEIITIPMFEDDLTKCTSQYQKEVYDYYFTDRGHHSNWADNKFPAISSVFTFSSLDYASLVSPTPLLAIVGSRAETAPQTYRMLELINDKKTTKLFTVKGASHIDLYDKDQYVNQAVEQISRFFRTN